jgi:hypothetical protein
MATKTLSQLHRLVFRKRVNDAWEVFTIEPQDLGQDSYITFNIAPRKQTRSSAVGTTETPIAGTFDALSASIEFLADNWKIIGEALGKWNAATYEGAAATAGNIILGGADDLCAGGEYYSVIAQGICDDGSTSDVEFTRCIPSVDDDVALGGSDTATVALALNPIIYNASEHASDGYPAYTARMGDANVAENQRLNPTTGEYTAVQG